jgi:formate dehydrogenase subunit beta
MDMVWAIETHGDPLGTLHKVMEQVWKEAGLDGWIISSDALDLREPEAHILDRPGQLPRFNPFHPAMRANMARFIPGILRESQCARFGAVLRPCEIRALNELERLDPFPRERLISLCIDCLGTFPANELEWRAERKASSDELARQILQFAHQGGIAVYRFRPACQVCPSPQAEEADINIGVLGLPARQHILLDVPAEKYAGRLGFQDLPLAVASPDQVARRDRVIGRITSRNHLTRERIVTGPAALVPAYLDALVQQLDRCGDCQKCLEACPICSVRPIQRGPGGGYDRQEVANWLISCAGCGMCEQACEKNLPLSAIFGVIRDQLHAMA